MSEMITRASLANALRVLKKNKRLSAMKSLAVACNIPIDALAHVLDVLRTTSYVKVCTFPKGNFKNYTFTMYGKGYVYIDPFFVMENGQLVGGSKRQSASFLTKNERDKHRNDAARKGLSVFTSSDFMPDLVEKMYNRIHDVAEPEMEDEATRLLKPYPLVFARYQTCLLEKSTLESQIQELQRKDEGIKKEYDHQVHLANSGLRTKREAYSVDVGTEEIYLGSFRSRNWFDDEGIMEDRFGTVRKYETRYRTVVDRPSPPRYHHDEVNNLKTKMADLEGRLSYMKYNLHTFEQTLQQERQQAQDLENYKTERRELDNKYNNRFK